MTALTLDELWHRQDPPWSIDKIVYFPMRKDIVLQQALSDLSQLLVDPREKPHTVFISYELPNDLGDSDCTLFLCQRAQRSAISRTYRRRSTVIDRLSPFGWVLDPAERGLLLHARLLRRQGNTEIDIGAYGLNVSSGDGPLTILNSWRMTGLYGKSPWELKALLGDAVHRQVLPQVDKIVVPALNPRADGALDSLLSLCREDFTQDLTVLWAATNDQGEATLMQLHFRSRPKTQVLGAPI